MTHSFGYGVITRVATIILNDTFEYLKWNVIPRPITLRRVFDSDMMPLCIMIGLYHCFFQPKFFKSIFRTKYCFES